LFSSIPHFLPLFTPTSLRTAPGLSKNGFIRAQQFVFQHTGADEEKLRNEFRILGECIVCLSTYLQLLWRYVSIA